MKRSMSILEKLETTLKGPGAATPAGSIRIVDGNALNWLYITYNTVEELVRVTPDGMVEPAAMKSFKWVDDRTLDIKLRTDEIFADGEPFTAAVVERSFQEVIRWTAPHPPGTQFNLDRRTRCEVTGTNSVRFHFPEPDGLALGKLRAVHMMGTPFWDIGFGYKRNGSGEGHW